MEFVASMWNRAKRYTGENLGQIMILFVLVGPVGIPVYFYSKTLWNGDGPDNIPQPRSTAYSILPLPGYRNIQVRPARQMIPLNHTGKTIGFIMPLGTKHGKIESPRNKIEPDEPDPANLLKQGLTVHAVQQILGGSLRKTSELTSDVGPTYEEYQFYISGRSNISAWFVDGKLSNWYEF